MNGLSNEQVEPVSMAAIITETRQARKGFKIKKRILNRIRLIKVVSGKGLPAGNLYLNWLFNGRCGVRGAGL